MSMITVETTAVKTSVNQPTTLVVKLTNSDKVEVNWKKDGQPVKHPALSDGSLYISKTNLSDEGKYTVIVKKNESSVVENLQLNVFDPQLPPGERNLLIFTNFYCFIATEKSMHTAIKVKDFAKQVVSLKAEHKAKLVEEFGLLTTDAPFTQHAAKLLCNQAKNRYIYKYSSL